jgi:hypothetical protein
LFWGQSRGQFGAWCYGDGPVIPPAAPTSGWNVPTGLIWFRCGLPALVLGVAGLRFLATAPCEIIGTAPFNTVSGIVGCVLAVLAVYGAVAFEVEGVKHRTVLPTLRHGAGSRALEPNLPEQVEQVAAEAGVRAQL